VGAIGRFHIHGLDPARVRPPVDVAGSHLRKHHAQGEHKLDSVGCDNHDGGKLQSRIGFFDVELELKLECVIHSKPGLQAENAAHARPRNSPLD
jgi:hypothetical protein